MNQVWTIGALLFCGCVAACGGGDDGGASGGGGAGGGSSGGTGAGPSGGTGGGTGEAMLINAAMGLQTVDKPFADEGKGAVGMLHMEYANDDLSTAVVKVNDTTVKQKQIGGHNVEATFDLQTSDVPAPGPLGAFKLEASYKGMTAAGSLPCPAGVTITSPAEGDSYAVGDTITVSWTGSVATDHPLFKSDLRLLGYDTAANQEYGSTAFQSSTDGIVVSLEGTATGGEVKAYEATGSQTGTFDGWVVQVQALGNYVSETNAVGYCTVASRVHIKKK